MHVGMCTGSDRELAQQLQACVRARRDDGGGAGADLCARSDRAPHSTMRALCGALSVDSGLRYKVKMWMFRAASAAPAAAAPARDVAGSAAPHVAYCMMTAVIRNGLAELKRGRVPLLAFARHVAENAALAGEHVRDVVAFADAWHAWATRHAPDVVRAGAAAGDRYLHSAEPFAEAFANGSALAGGGPGERFRGIMLMVGFEPDVVAAVAARLGAQCEEQGRVQWSHAMAIPGAVVSLLPWAASVRPPPPHFPRHTRDPTPVPSFAPEHASTAPALVCLSSHHQSRNALHLRGCLWPRACPTEALHRTVQACQSLCLLYIPARARLSAPPLSLPLWRHPEGPCAHTLIPQPLEPGDPTASDTLAHGPVESCRFVAQFQAAPSCRYPQRASDIASGPRLRPTCCSCTARCRSLLRPLPPPPMPSAWPAALPQPSSSPSRCRLPPSPTMA